MKVARGRLWSVYLPSKARPNLTTRLKGGVITAPHTVSPPATTVHR